MNFKIFSFILISLLANGFGNDFQDPPAILTEQNNIKVFKKIKRFFKKGSFVYEIGSVDLPNGGIGFINGINNSLKEAQRHAKRLSAYAGGIKISHVYNATHSSPVDVATSILEKCGVKMPPIEILRDQWEDFIATHSPEAMFLQICHSQGALHVKNALLASSQAVRDRIIVLAIAPVAIISKDICHASANYASMGDFVSLLDIQGRDLYSEELVFLEPHADAPRWDHNFNSPTYQSILQDHITTFINTCKSLS